MGIIRSSLRLVRPLGLAAISAATVMALFGGQATAHSDVRMTICIPYYKGGECAAKGENPSYTYGDTVTVRGRAIPTHRGVVRIKRSKGEEPWRVVAKVEIDDNGRYVYRWRTNRDDADQTTPYLFKTVLRNHDGSRTQGVYVLFGE